MHSKPTPSFLLMVIVIGSIGLLASDIYLAALPDMAVYFGVKQEAVQTTFTVYLAGLALCQLLYGVLSDFIGRRNVLLGGSLLFIVASLLCAEAATLRELNFFRFLQAMGAGITVINRVLVAERYDRAQTAAILTTTFPIIGMAPAIAPLFGGYISYTFGWRYTFYVMAWYGLIVFLISLFGVKEHSKKSCQFIFSTYSFKAVLSNFDFIGYALVVCTGFAVFRSYMTESPFVFKTQGFAIQDISYFYFAVSIAYLIGNLCAKWLIKKISMNQVLIYGFVFFIIGTVVLVLAAHFYSDNNWAAILPMCIVTVGNGFMFPVASACALSTVPTEVGGTAAGILGAMQLIVAACCISAIGYFSQGEIFRMAIFIGAITMVGACFFWFLVVRRARQLISV